MLRLKAERITGDLGVVFHSLRRGVFVETYKAAYKRGYDAEHMAAQF